MELVLVKSISGTFLVILAVVLAIAVHDLKTEKPCEPDTHD